ncbi:entry exclusion protein TrbK [Sinorhizobium prairiense]|uniref:entry exclusion protein TrbK n=1 Tax=unclassified Sinorhizobium TaxID=2613772 RepID=UPI0023D7CA88|nr:MULTISPECIES: entry exclusion protein TrbK [unclassified Sinorhizobium]WEJ08468.1 entry exclusion protein TrbK [Sinorhizobium sp. M103]WEJ14028.1 entry exclusion protein TrbK [Sinorhizobium sp. K101]WEJ35628.1 entry exclusion protein TrbK [Sinorhizobium sp. C101]
MNRANALLLVTLSLSMAAITLNVTSRDSGKLLTDEQRSAQERFFGSGSGLPPIKDAQEMRPRW